ncbi:Natural resistance-associated macrophage protein [Caballeronia sp. SBC1]|nr:Natural resistance-associated macrophage protein [Caballeronia sp. SBC2]QIN61563.1 Natural resistance-associated macrophage protein [Caballeronia sp. SBC1]
MLWTIIVTYPLMVVIQVISAWLGRVSGHGLATNIRRRYPAWLLYGSVFLLLVAIAVDPPAMGAAVNLVIGGSVLLYTIGLALFSVLLQVVGCSRGGCTLGSRNRGFWRRQRAHRLLPNLMVAWAEPDIGNLLEARGPGLA